jgi:long-chain fatty acid transport protein
MINKLTAVLLFCSNVIFAGGFQVNLQGQKQAAMGHAATGLLTDASSIFFNPGAVCFLDSVYQLQMGSSFIIPNVQYLELAPGNYTARTELNIGTPFSVYAAAKTNLGNKWYYGIGIYTPFGSRVQWADDWKGQFLIREINLKTIFIQPTFSYQVNEKIGFGIGPLAAVGGFSLRKGIPVQDTAGNYGEGILAGKANGFGFNAGIYFRPTENFSLGIDYRSAVKVKVKNGDANFTVPESLKEFFPQTSFTTAIKLPQVISAGAGYKCGAKWTFSLDLNFVGWQSYDTLRIDFKDTTAKLQNIRSARNYQNTFMYRAGAQYIVNENVTIRFGAYFDPSPVDAGYLTPETPDANRIGITTGASFYISEKVKLDCSFLYIEGMKRSDVNLETQFGGTYKSRAFVPGFALEIEL